jgi:alkylhydroperoxidase family enzyme
MQYGRLPWLCPNDLDARQRALYDAVVGSPRATGPRPHPLTGPGGRLQGPFNAMLFSPPVGSALEQLGTALRYRSTLPDRMRELAILEVARRCGSTYEWRVHETAARRAGLTPADLDALWAGGPVPSLAPEERRARDFCAALVEHDDVGDELFAAALTDLGAVMLTELVTLVGYYRGLALSLRVFRTPLPGPEDVGEGAGGVGEGPVGEATGSGTDR